MDEVGAPSSLAELEDRVLPWSQVKVISGLSRTTVWRLQKTGDFPASVQVSRNRVGWWQSEILEWRRSRIPRRLPEPKRPPASSASTVPPASVAATTEGRSRATASPTPAAGRRRRGRPEAPEQGTFDFGS